MAFFGEFKRIFGGPTPPEGHDASHNPIKGYKPEYVGHVPPKPVPVSLAARVPYPELPVETLRDIFREAQKTKNIQLPVSTKPSNPKDVMGVGKAPMSTVSQLVLAEVGVAMLEGALKYGRHNYRGVGVLASIYFDAATRHLRSWWEGEDLDKASQLSHITKAITSLIVLRDAMIMDKFTDDRPPAHPDIAGFMEDLDDRAAALVKRDGHIQPKHYTNLNK